MKKELELIGLTDGESRCYLALLKLGKTTVGPISKSSKIAQSKIYDVLGRLIEKGLVSYTTLNKIRYYQAVAPERIQDYIDKQKEALLEAEEKYLNLLPSLHLHQKESEDSNAEVFIGKEGLKSAYEILMKECTDTEIYFMYIYNKDKKYEIDKFYGSLDYNNLKWKGLFSKDYEPTHLVKEMHEKITYRFSSTPIPISIDISSKKVILTDWFGKNPTAILISSKEIASNFRRYFELMWLQAKE